MTGHAGNGTPGGRRSRPPRGTGRHAAAGSADRGGACGGSGVRLRRRDGTGRSSAGGGAARAGMDATVRISPATGRTDAAAAPSITAPGAPARAAGAGRGMVVRLTDPEACIGCGMCVAECPRSALGLHDVPTVDEGLCTGCGRCVEVCPAGALALVTA